LNRATFFRHFADKRRSCSAVKLLAGLVRRRHSWPLTGCHATECLQAAFEAPRPRYPAAAAKAAQRVLVVTANTEVQERGLLKARPDRQVDQRRLRDGAQTS